MIYDIFDIDEPQNVVFQVRITEKLGGFLGQNRMGHTGRWSNSSSVFVSYEYHDAKDVLLFKLIKNSLYFSLEDEVRLKDAFELMSWRELLRGRRLGLREKK